MDDLRYELKELIIDTLTLSGVTPADIGNADPLFGDGLGLDSLDALELVVELEAKYETGVEVEGEQARDVFRSIDTLAEFIAAHRTQ